MVRRYGCMHVCMYVVVSVDAQKVHTCAFARAHHGEGRPADGRAVLLEAHVPDAPRHGRHELGPWLPGPGRARTRAHAHTRSHAHTRAHTRARAHAHTQTAQIKGARRVSRPAMPDPPPSLSLSLSPSPSLSPPAPLTLFLSPSPSFSPSPSSLPPSLPPSLPFPLPSPSRPLST